MLDFFGIVFLKGEYMNKKILLASLMVAVVGFSSVFAQEEEKDVQFSIACDKCDNAEEELEVITSA